MLPVHCTTNDPHLESGTPDFVGRVAAEIAAVLRPGWVVAPRQAVFIRAVEDLADELLVRCDGRRNLLAIAWVYARHTGRPPEAAMICSPSRALVVELTGLSEATVKRWTCWMVRHGVLAQLEVGRLARFRAMAVQAEGGRVSVYVLCARAATAAPAPVSPVVEVLVGDVSRGVGAPGPVGSVDKSDPSVCLGFVVKRNPYPGARASRSTAAVHGFRAGEQRSDKQGSGPWPRGAVAGSRRDRLALIERLQAAAPALRPASPRALRSVLGSWLERPELGWTVAQLLYAIDHTPTGQAHTFTAAVKIPHRWLAHRMSAWLDETGAALPSPRAAATAARAAGHAADELERAQRRHQFERIEAERAFGELIRDVAGGRYPALVQAVMAGHSAARLLPAGVAEALVREAVRSAVRDRVPADHGGLPALRHTVTTVIDELLHVAGDAMSRCQTRGRDSR